MTSLKDQRKILERNMRWEDDKVANNKSYTGPNGKTYGPDHYKESVNYTSKDLEEVNNKLKKVEKINQLKEKAESVIKNVAKKVSDVATPTVGSMTKDLLKKKKK